MFWVGFGIGVIIGAMLRIMCIALVTANHRSEKDNKEQAMCLAMQKDRKFVTAQDLLFVKILMD